MALTEREKKMLKLLIPTVIAAGVIQFGPFGKKKAPPSTPQAKGPSPGGTISKKFEKVVPSRQPVTPRPPATLQEFSTWGTRDPFSEPEFPSVLVPKPPSSVGLSLKGIVWIGDTPYVLINGEIIGVGEEKKGIRVERVEGRKVVCRRGGKTYTLEWREMP